MNGVQANLAAAVLIALAVLAIVGPALAPFDPHEPVAAALSSPSTAHPLGTNHLGQDVLSRIIVGAQTTLPVTALATLLALALGSIVGLGAGLAQGWADKAFMRIIDVLLAVPRLPLLIVAASFLGPSKVSITVLIGLLSWASVARILRSEVQTLRNRGYLRYSAGQGASRGFVIRRHLVRQLTPLLAAQAILVASTAALLEASLAFIGLADPTAISWARDVERGLREPGVLLTDAWLWTVVAPGLAITATLICIALAGAGLRSQPVGATGVRA